MGHRQPGGRSRGRPAGTWGAPQATVPAREPIGLQCWVEPGPGSFENFGPSPTLAYSIIVPWVGMVEGRNFQTTGILSRAGSTFVEPGSYGS